MKKIILLLLLSPMMGANAFAQNPEAAALLVEEGVVLHDKGDFKGALAKYDQALELDKNNLFGLAEKAYTLFSLGKYEEAIACCQKDLEVHRGEKDLHSVYVTYGNALDALKRPADALKIYNEGLGQFPRFHSLFFNKGITLSGMGRNGEAFDCFIQSVSLNPGHPGSHNAIARLVDPNKARLPSLLAYWTFLLLEPEGKRAKENMERMLGVLGANVKQEGDKNIKITVDAEADKLTENNFSQVEVALSMGVAANIVQKDKSTAEKLASALAIVCETLESAPKDQGFFWTHYAPFFIELGQQKFTETFAYIMLITSGDPAVIQWIKAHDEDVDKFYKWVEAYEWKK